MLSNALKVLRLRPWEVLGAFIVLTALAFAIEADYLTEQFGTQTMPKLIMAGSIFFASARCLLLDEGLRWTGSNSTHASARQDAAKLTFPLFLWVLVLSLPALLVGIAVAIYFYDTVEQATQNNRNAFEIAMSLFIAVFAAPAYGLTMALFGTKIPAMAVGAEHGFKTTLNRGRRTFFFVLGRLILGPLIVRVLFVAVGFYSLTLLPPNALLPYISIFFVTLGFVISTLLEGTIYAMALQRAEPDLKVKLQDTEQPPAP